MYISAHYCLFMYDNPPLGPVDLYSTTVTVRAMLLSADSSDATAVHSLSFEVISAVAEQEGIDPMDIEPPEYDALYDVINPEALDSLFAPREDGTSRGSGRVEFVFCGYHVVVTSDGDVDVLEEKGGR
ncbi:hypothetical protein Htur_1717 [Haloterrigena turkmenica DSM 5511]|uniref:Halobacterial output domain-containing protein n=2 Tax=Haloterrigena turkmenica TaxID=62320 RepID=D2RS21_HALTV|nr:hypothetical protein Htur_1717 [Haloterrigena turkmenica DSM 5511]